MCINFPPIDVEDDCSYYPFCIFCEKLYRSFSVVWKFFFFKKKIVAHYFQAATSIERMVGLGC